MVLLTSRVSVEMVQKTAAIGAPLMVAVSAPTALAVRTADAAGITLAAIARSDGFEIFTHPERIASTQNTAVAGGRPCRLTGLIYMANQIGKFFQSQGHDKAVPGIADHIKKFWDPRMRKAIFAHLDSRRRRARSQCPRRARDAEEGVSHRSRHSAPHGGMADMAGLAARSSPSRMTDGRRIGFPHNRQPINNLGVLI